MTSSRLFLLLTFTATALLAQNPPAIPPGWVLVDDEILPEAALAGDATWFATPWPGGIVPFDFDASVTALNQTRALDAMADVAALGNVTFVPRTTQVDWVRFFNSPVNNSYIGKIGGMQPININAWTWRFIIAHEVNHALGFWHEHQRPDRDSYVTVNWGNVQGAFINNFIIFGGATTTGTYDFDSVMHYHECEFSIGCAPGGTCLCGAAHVIDVLPPYAMWQSTLGQRAHMSVGDAAGIVAHYGAAVAPSIASIAPPFGVANAFQTITITGSRFCKGSIDGLGALGTGATWDGVALTVTYVSPTQLSADVSANLATPGYHLVRVENPSPGGGQSTAFNYHVGAPVANFVATPTTGTSPLTVSFTDTSTAGAIAWAWAFGDGATSNSQNPSHTYACGGPHHVSLTTTWSFGSDVETKLGYVNVGYGPAQGVHLNLEFNQPGLLPDASHGFSYTVPAGFSLPAVATATCGMLQFRELTAAVGIGNTTWTKGNGGPPLGLDPQLQTVIETRVRPLALPATHGLFLEAADGLHRYLTYLQPNSIWIYDGTSFAIHPLPTPALGGFHVLRVVGTPTTGGSATVQAFWDGVAISPPIASGMSPGFNYFGFGQGCACSPYDADFDYIRLDNGPACSGPGQPNSDLARLEVNGTGLGVRGGPISIGGLSGDPLTFTWAGPPLMPFALLAGLPNPGHVSFGCIGSLDIGVPPLYSDLGVLFDGTAPGLWGQLFKLDACGIAQQSFTVPPLPPGTVLGNFQGIIVQPTGCPLVLTTAFYLQG